MAFVDFFQWLMIDTLTATPGVVDAYGAFVPSGAVLSLPCRVEGSSRLTRDAQGREVVSSIQVIVGGYNGLTTENHRYTLPTRFNPNSDIQAISVEKEIDEVGPSYEVVLFP